MTTLVDELTPEARQFCEREGLGHYLQLAESLVGECFPPGAWAGIELVTDPASGERWLNINVRVPGSVDTVLDAYNRYTERWAEVAPWPAVNQISLTCDIT